MVTASTLTDIVSRAQDEVAARAASLPPPSPVQLTPVELAALIDHTLLKPEASEAQVRQLCAEAQSYGFASVCVNASWTPLCARLLEGTGVKVCTVVGFPLGATLSSVKAFEARAAIEHGAQEVDMVLAIGQLKDRDYVAVHSDMRAVVEAARPASALVKVIIETVLLSDTEKIAASILAKEAGADFVKTSTGFAGGGATVADIQLMRLTVGPTLGIKASGGVRSAADALALVAAGATRIGASAGVKIVEELAAGLAVGKSHPATKDAY
jgi:deoxyribose-phosphate aldolase